MIDIPLDRIYELSEYARDTLPPEEFIGSKIEEFDNGSFMIYIKTTRGDLTLNFGPDDTQIGKSDDRDP